MMSSRINTNPIVRLSGGALVVMMLVLSVTPASADKMSKRQQAIVKHVKAECKEKAAQQAKGFGFVERWRAYSDCINEASKANAGLDFTDID
jgi:hypothetical protein